MAKDANKKGSEGMELPTMRARLAEMKAPERYVIKDTLGDNYVHRIEKVDDGYKIIGANNSGQPRSITMKDDGTVTGYEGKKLGVVESQMRDNRVDIFAHFNVDLPEIYQPKAGPRPD